MIKFGKIFTAASVASFLLLTGTSFAQTCQTLEQYGGGTSSADNTAAFNSAVSAANTNPGGCIEFRAGYYTFNSALNVNLTGGYAGFSLKGQGPNVTILRWPSTSGITFNYNGSLNSVTVADLSLMTSQGNDSTVGLALNASDDRGRVQPTTIRNVSILGFDPGSTHWWGKAIYVNGVSSVSIHDVNVWGGNPGGGSGGNARGIGVHATSTPPSKHGVVMDLTRYRSFNNTVGLQVSGVYEGVTVSQSNFTNCYRGIYGNQPYGDNHIGPQLTVADSQFDCSGAGIISDANWTNVLINNNLFIVDDAETAVYFPNGYSSFGFTNNDVSGLGNIGNGVILNNAAGNAAGSITGNRFSGLSAAVWLQTGSGRTKVQANTYTSNSQNIIDQNGTNTLLD